MLATLPVSKILKPNQKVDFSKISGPLDRVAVNKQALNDVVAVFNCTTLLMFST